MNYVASDTITGLVNEAAVQQSPDLEISNASQAGWISARAAERATVLQPPGSEITLHGLIIGGMVSPPQVAFGAGPANSGPNYFGKPTFLRRAFTRGSPRSRANSGEVRA